MLESQLNIFVLQYKGQALLIALYNNNKQIMDIALEEKNLDEFLTALNFRLFVKRESTLCYLDRTFVITSLALEAIRYKICLANLESNETQRILEAINLYMDDSEKVKTISDLEMEVKLMES